MKKLKGQGRSAEGHAMRKRSKPYARSVRDTILDQTSPRTAAKLLEQSLALYPHASSGTKEKWRRAVAAVEAATRAA